VDELSPRGTRVPELAAALPLDTRALAEALAERLDLAVGQCRLELELQDGRLLHVWRHAKVKASALTEGRPQVS
jgi:hypothetical protein